MSIKEIAKVVHNLQSAFCSSIGDHTVPTWDNAPQWMKDTTIDGVYALLGDTTAEAGFSHTNWMNKKFAEGWVYGEIKDAVKKTHPSLIPFDKLPWEDQYKDILFVKTVRELHEHWA